MKKANSQTSSSSNYPIPTFNVQVLINALTEMGVVPTLTNDNLNHPNPDLVLKVLGNCMEKFLDETIEDIRQRNREYGAEAGEGIDTYANVLEFIEIFRKIQKVLVTAKLDDFSISDIIKPQTKRFKLALFAFLNLARFREQIIDVYNQIISEFDNLQNEKQELLIALERDNNALDSFKEQERVNEGRLKVLGDKVREMTQAIQEMTLKDMELKTTLQNVQAENEHLDKDIDIAHHHLDVLTKENKTLKSQIVPNPDDLKKRILLLRKCIETNQSELKTLEEEIQQLTLSDMKNAEQFSKILTKSITLSEQLEELRNRKKEINKNNKTKQESIERVQSKLVEMDNVKKQQEKQNQALSEKIERIEVQFYEKLERATAMENDALKEKEAQEAHCREIKEKNEAAKQRILELERYRAQMTQRYKSEIENIVSGCRSVESGTDNFHGNVIAAVSHKH